ncbi:MAG: YvcK family protein [Clostridia bacterium]|jgi:uncharacterized cofD-like protein|nr:YvcK family protein [Clostridia bacterium]
MEDKKITVIGGGTGLSTLLRGLKKYNDHITAIVAVTDDGGSSGKLRKDLGILPPGDIRNCLVALSREENLMKEVFQHRFSDGDLKGQCLGNLFIAGLAELTGSFSEAISKTSEILAISGKVLPVTLEDLVLHAQLENNEVIAGESVIGEGVIKHKTSIKRMFLDKENVKPAEGVVDAILNSDVIILGPGSLYTSIIPNLLVEDVSKSLIDTSAEIIYICNTVTQPGETTGYDVYNHVNAIEETVGQNIISKCIVFDGEIPNHLLSLYQKNGASKVEINEEKLKNVDIYKLKKANIKIDAAWHDIDELSDKIREIVVEEI